MVLHDLNLAARYADHVVAMRAGRIVAQGRPAEVFTVDLLAEVFGLAAMVIGDPVTGTPLVVPLPRPAGRA
jgi:iron complex transport system ATP-binding protein